MVPLNGVILAAVIAASVAVAVTTRETDRATVADNAFRTLAAEGCLFYAPGTIVTEVLYAICQKHGRGGLNDVEYDEAIAEFDVLMRDIHPPPTGDAALVRRIHGLNLGYGCSRSADAAYVALAEELARSMPTVLLTFDKELPRQAARNAPSVPVRLL